MDLYKAIDQLRRERDRVDSCIAYIESMLAGTRAGSAPRRPRKAHKKAAGLGVSEDMVRYWRSRGRGGEGGAK